MYLCTTLCYTIVKVTKALHSEAHQLNNSPKKSDSRLAPLGECSTSSVPSSDHGIASVTPQPHVKPKTVIHAYKLYV